MTPHDSTTDLLRFSSIDDVNLWRLTDPEQVARSARHAAIDEQARRIKVWIGIQAAAYRASLAGKSYKRSVGQLIRWRT
jgi:hypothetical protein